MTATDLAKRDMTEYATFVALKNNQVAMRDAHTRLASVRHNNKYLDGIVEDYARFSKYLRESNESKIDALRKLTGYVDQMKQVRQMTDRELKSALSNQREILAEIARLRVEIEGEVTTKI